MAEITRRVGEYRSLWVWLALVTVLSTAVITSCGSGGGGGSDGELCDQCGDDPDGPCRDSITITPGDGQPQCTRPVDSATNTCIVELTCRRKTDEGQRRCFPLAPGGADVDYQFRCDGSRPGGTPRPEPTPTETEPEPTDTPQPNCGNDIVDSGEECDGSNNGLLCENFGCTTPLIGGGLACDENTCNFDFDGCEGSCTRL